MEGRIEQVSDAWLSLLGYARQEVIGRPLVNFMTEASARQRITMTGLQLASAIRQAWPGLPVVLATGYAELPEGALHDLCRVKKPFDQEALAQIIRASQAPAPAPQNVVPLRAMQG